MKYLFAGLKTLAFVLAVYIIIVAQPLKDATIFGIQFNSIIWMLIALSVLLVLLALYNKKYQ